MAHLWRQLMRLWPLYGLVFILLVLSVAIVSAIPLFAQQLADRALQQELSLVSIPERNILLRGRVLGNNSEADLVDTLGPLYADKLELFEANQLAESIIYRNDVAMPIDGEILDFLNFNLYGFTQLEEQVTVINGRLPQHTVFDAVQQNPNLEEITEPVFIEIAIGEEVATFLNLQIGDQILSFDHVYLFEIVGIVKPTDPSSERWWGDEELLPFSFWRRISLSPDFVEVNAGILLHPDSMRLAFPAYARSWRILIDQSLIQAAETEQLEANLNNLTTDMGNRSVGLQTGLIRILAQFNGSITQGQQVMLLLITQSLLAVLYTLAILGRTVGVQSNDDIIMMSVRGISPILIIAQFVIRYLFLILLAWPLGTWIAISLFPQPIIPPLIWRLGGGILLFGLLALVWPILTAVQQGNIGWMHQRAFREDRFTWRRQLFFDGAVLLLGGFTFWQLRQFSNTAVSQEGALLNDPILLLSPTILILGCALILRHLVPILIGVLAKASQWTTLPLLPLSLTWLSRDRVRSERIVFMVSVVTGLVLFASLFTRSLELRQAEIANYVSGADLRWSVTDVDLQTVTDALNDQNSITSVETVFRDFVIYESSAGNQQLSMLAVSPNIAPVISPYPQESNPVPIENLLNRLDNPSPEAVPVLLSRRNVIPGVGVGDRLNIRVGTTSVPIEVRDIIETFSTVDTPFIIMNLDELRPYIDQLSSDLRKGENFEIWAKAQTENNSLPAVYQTLITSYGTPYIAPIPLSDVGIIRAQINNHVISQQIIGVFRLNAVVLMTLSVVSLFLLQLLDGRQRRPTWGNFMALGVQKRHIRTLLLNEGISLLLLGVLIGLGLGLLLIQIMRPLLTLILSTTVGTPYEAILYFEATVLGGTIGVMALLYGIVAISAAMINGRIPHVSQLLRYER